MEKKTSISSTRKPGLTAFWRSVEGSTVSLAALSAARAHKWTRAQSLSEWVSALEEIAHEEPLRAVHLAQLASILILAKEIEDAVSAAERVVVLAFEATERGFNESSSAISGAVRCTLLTGSVRADCVMFLTRSTANSNQLVLWCLPVKAPGVDVQYLPLADDELEISVQLSIPKSDVHLYAFPLGEAHHLPWLNAVKHLAFAGAACGLAGGMQRLAVERQLKHIEKYGPTHLSIHGLGSCAAHLNAARALLRDASNAPLACDAQQALFCASESLQEMHALLQSTFKPGAIASRQSVQPLLKALQFLQSAVGEPKEQAANLAEHIMNSSTPRKRSNKQALPASDEGERKISREFEILDAAADAFNSQGYDATSIDHIGSALGITKGSIYHHYRSKADLLVAVYQRVMEINFRAIEPIANDRSLRPVQRIYRMAHTHAMQVLKHLSYQRLAVQGLEAQLIDRVSEEQREKLQKIIELRSQYQQMFLGVFQEAINAEEIPQQDIRMSIKPFFGAINGATMWYKPRPDETTGNREQIATQLASFVTSGLALVIPFMEHASV